MTLNGCQEASNAIVLPKYILSPCSKSKGVEELSKAYVEQMETFFSTRLTDV